MMELTPYNTAVFSFPIYTCYTNSGGIIWDGTRQYASGYNRTGQDGRL